jgi:hypothetical protein
MPQYEVEVNGKVYEVEAESPEMADEAARGQAYVNQRRADVAPQQAHQRSLPAKLRKGLADAPQRVLESMSQLLTALGEATGAQPFGTVEDQTARMNTRRLLATEGDEAIEDAADIGEVALLGLPVGASAAAARGTTTVRGLLGRGVAQPAVEAAVLNPASETATSPLDVMKERALAGGVSAAITTPTAAVSALRPSLHNYMVALKQRAVRNQATLDARRTAGDFLGNQDALTVSQQTGNDIARSLEVQVKATDAQNFFVKQFERYQERWDLMVRDFARQGGIQRGDVSYLGTARRLSDAWKASEASAQSAASALYGNRLNQVLTIAARDPSRFPVPFNNLAQATDDIAAGSGGGDWWRAIYPGAERPSFAIRRLDDYLKQVQGGPFTQGLDIPELVNMRRALNQMDQDFYQAIRSNPNVASDMLSRHATLRKVIRAVDADIAAFRQSVPANRPARQALEEYAAANDEYGQFKDMQDFMRQTATGQLFGGTIPMDPQAYLKRVAEMEPAQQTVLVNILRQQDPEALAHLRVSLVESALDQGRKAALAGREASRGPVDINAIGKAMVGENGAVAQRIFSPAQFAEVNKGLAAIRVLNEAAEGGISVSRSPNFESGAMAGVSMAGAFLARMAYRLAGARIIERVMFTPEGIQSLDVAADLYRANRPVSANKIARAVGYLAAASGTAGEMDPELVEWVEAND